MFGLDCSFSEGRQLLCLPSRPSRGWLQPFSWTGLRSLLQSPVHPVLSAQACLVFSLQPLEFFFTVVLYPNGLCTYLYYYVILPSDLTQILLPPMKSAGSLHTSLLVLLLCPLVPAHGLSPWDSSHTALDHSEWWVSPLHP